MKKIVCRERDCNEPPYSGGYCKKHHEEKLLKDKNEQEAKKAIFYLEVDDKEVTNSDLKADLQRLNNWWNRATLALRTNTSDDILDDETEASLAWCVSLAEEIVKAERRIRNGESIESSLNITRNWVWERFNNLEKGLRSNGTKR
jgi:hypothetical protein